MADICFFGSKNFVSLKTKQISGIVISRLSACPISIYIKAISIYIKAVHNCQIGWIQFIPLSLSLSLSLSAIIIITIITIIPIIITLTNIFTASKLRRLQRPRVRSPARPSCSLPGDHHHHCHGYHIVIVSKWSWSSSSWSRLSWWLW